MKPDPYLLATACHHLAATPDKTVFIGDSLSDAQAAATLDVPFIGLTKQPDRLGRFDASTTAAVLVTITELTTRSQV